MKRRLVALEAAWYLVCARMALRCVPFHAIRQQLIRPVTRCARSSATQALVREVRGAVAAAARRLPGQTVCFPRAIAAQAMLRRRGIASTVCYGARSTGPEGLEAHVWLTVEGQGVVGHEQAAGFVQVTTYPTVSSGALS